MSSRGLRRLALAGILAAAIACSTPESAAPPTAGSGVASSLPADNARLAPSISATSRPSIASPTPTSTSDRPTTAPTTSAAVPSDAVPVSSVYDGDTLRVKQGGETVPIRVLGVNAPELRPQECWGPEARDAARALLLGQSVVLTADPKQGDKDRYGRLLRYVQLPDGRDLGHTLVAEGDVTVYEEYPVSKTPEYRVAQEQARAAREGLWAACWG